MIFVTGDTHIPIDIRKLNTKNFPEQTSLTKSDYLIICGDFGGVWYHQESPYYNEQNYWLSWLNSKNFTTLFVDGNHENFDLLEKYPEVEKFGGKVHQIESSIFHLERGQVFEIDGKKLFTMGGANSHDKEHRVQYVSWWPQEMPVYAEYEEALYNLNKNDWKVDYIFTHCAPTSIQQGISNHYEMDSLTTFLEQIAAQTSFRKWYFGHYHMDFQYQNFRCLYQQIEKVE